MSIVTTTSVNGNNSVSFDNKPNAKQRYKLDGKPVAGVTTFIKQGWPTPEPLTIWKIGKGAEYSAIEVLGKAKYDKSLDHIIISPEKLAEIIKDSKTAWKTHADEAAGIGIIIHDYSYLSSLKRDEEALEMLAEHEGTPQWAEIQNAVYKVDDFIKQNNDEILHLETIVGSTKYQYAGRFDRLVKRDGKVILSDYKTSNGFYLEQFIQDGAYAIAIEEWLGITVEGFEVIRFGKKDGDFQSLLLTDPSELDAFKNAAFRCLDNYNLIKTFAKDKRFKCNR